MGGETADPGQDPRGAPDPAALKGKLDVCPRLLFDATPDAPVGGDFAQHIVTLGDGETLVKDTPALVVEE